MKPAVVIGAGGHARVVADALVAAGHEVLGFTDANSDLHGTTVDGHTVIGGDNALDRLGRNEVLLAVGVGSIGPVTTRRVIYERYAADGWSFVEVIHPTAWISPSASVGSGAQILAGAVVQTGARVGQNAIVNSNATVDHDCEIGDHVHVAPGATLSGAVRVGACSHIGTGASIIQGVTIGAHSLVAAGAVVTRVVGDNARVGGVPARPLPG